jgi:hypothetical protein
MASVSRAAFARLARLADARPGLVARVRLIALLALLVPLFGGLQALIEESVPRVEIRIVPREVPVQIPVEVPVQVPVDRVVERVVYVTVPADATPAPTPDAATPTPATPVPTPQDSGPPSAGAPAAPPPGVDGTGATSAGPPGPAPAAPVARAPGSAVLAPGSSGVLVPDAASGGAAQTNGALPVTAATPAPRVSTASVFGDVALVEVPVEPADVEVPPPPESLGQGTVNLSSAETNEPVRPLSSAVVTTGQTTVVEWRIVRRSGRAVRPAMNRTGIIGQQVQTSTTVSTETGPLTASEPGMDVADDSP